ncbi:MAG: hypothetical protein GYA57_01995 [Myxococcales bacterium]|nr:hypothetical protein [Myxococcales bacterium]
MSNGSRGTSNLSLAALAAACTFVSVGCGDDTQPGDSGDVEAGDDGEAGDGDADTGAESDGTGGPTLVILEAESIPVNEYWVVCPGPDCEDDRTATASAHGHLMTRESLVTGGPEGRIRTTVTLPFAGSWYLWAKSARAGAERAWGASFAGTDVASPFGTSGRWENGGEFHVAGPAVVLEVYDATPDAYWDYPDAFLLTDDPAFDPNDCPGGGAQATDCLPGNHAPQIHLRPADAAEENAPYAFDLTAEDPDGDPLTFAWTQTAGPAVAAFDATARRPEIRTPAVDADTTLSFAVTVSDPGGLTAEATIDLEVLDRLAPLAAHRTCAEITHPWPCVEVSSCGSLPEANRYYLLTRDLTASGTCLLTTDDVVIDLNGYTVTFDAGFDGGDLDLQNGGFEANAVGDPGSAVVAWDLSAAPGASVVSTWEMPLVGDKALYVPAGGTIVSPWVRLPVPDRSYRGQIVQRGPGAPVTLAVERQTGGAPEVVCTREVTDSLGGGKAVFCNFHGQPAGLYRLRVTSTRDQYYDAADIVPARNAGLGAVGYYTAYEIPDRPSHVCNADDGSCHLPDQAGSGGPTCDGGRIDVRHGTIVAGSWGMKSFGIYVDRADLVVRDVTVRMRGVNAKTVEAGRAYLFQSTFEADMPWVIDREDISETGATLGGGSAVWGCEFVGGQGCLSLAHADGATVRRSRFINRATVTNHYAISLGGSEHVLVEGNTFNCVPEDPSCVPFSGSGILFYRTRHSEVRDNEFHVVAARCDAEYVDGVFTTNALRLTDYDAAPGAADGVFGNVVARNRFDLRADAYPQMPDCECYANGVFYSVGAGDNVFEDNEFDSEARSPAAYSYAAYIGASHNGGVWRRNTFRTNDKAVWFSSAYGPAANARFVGNTFERVANPYYAPAAPEAAIRLGYCCGYEADSLDLVDNRWTGGFDRNAFWFTSNQPAPYSFAFRWTGTVTVTLEGERFPGDAIVTLAGTGETVAAHTDGTGAATLTATEYRQSGTNNRESTTRERVDVTPHVLTVEPAGRGPWTGTVTVGPDWTQHVELP